MTIRKLVGDQQRFRTREPFTSQRGGQQLDSLRLFTAAAVLALGEDVVALIVKYLQSEPTGSFSCPVRIYRVFHQFLKIVDYMLEMK